MEALEDEFDADWLGRLYHYRTEVYDRQNMTGPMGRDGILPANPREQGWGEANARSVYLEVVRWGLEHAIQKTEVESAIRRAASVPFEQLKAEFDHGTIHVRIGE